MPPKRKPSGPYRTFDHRDPEKEARLDYARSGPIHFKGQIWYPILGKRPRNASWTGGYNVYFVNDDHTDYITFGFDYVNLTRILFNRIRNARKDIYGIDRNYNYYF